MASGDPRVDAIRRELAALYVRRVRVEEGLRDGLYETSEPVDPNVEALDEYVPMYHTSRLVMKLCPEKWRRDRVEALEDVLRVAIAKLPDESLNPHLTEVTWRQLAQRIYILGNRKRVAKFGHFHTELQRQAFANESDEQYQEHRNSRGYWMKQARIELAEALLAMEAEADGNESVVESPPDHERRDDLSVGGWSAVGNQQRPEAESQVGSARRRYRPFRRPKPGTRPHSEARISALDRLEAVVTRRCDDEWVVLRLAERYPMPVRWELAHRDVADSPQSVFGDDEAPAFDVRTDEPDDLAEQFLGLDRQRLVILGEAGAGKSVLAHVLQRELLAMRTWVIPVILPVSRWDVDKFPKLRDWLVFRLIRDFPDAWGAERRSLSVVEQLVDTGNVLPILDGLDEAAPQTLAKIWAALGDYSTRGGLVLACRTDVYRKITSDLDVIKSAAVIEGQDLRPVDAVAYLEQAMTPRQLPRWSAVFAVLQSQVGTPLSEVCAQPLGLWLIRTIYVDTDGREAGRAELAHPTQLLDRTIYPTASVLKNHLFADLIPTVIRRRMAQSDGRDPVRPRREWNSNKAQQWLGYIANELSGASDIRWWQLPHLARALSRGIPKLEEPGRNPIMNRSPIPFLVSTLKDDQPTVDLALGLFAGPFIVFIVSVMPTRYSRSIAELLPVSISGRILVATIIATIVAVAGPVIACFNGLKAWMTLSHDHSLNTFDPECPSCFAEERNRTRWRSPMSSYRDSRNRAVAAGVGSALGGFVFYAIIASIWKLFNSMIRVIVPWPYMASNLDHLTSLAYRSVISGVILLALIIAVLVEPAWFMFFISSKWLALRGKLPWRTLAFLDDAYRLGLLRASGAVYEFRHAELRDYLRKWRGQAKCHGIGLTLWQWLVGWATRRYQSRASEQP